ncbi:hypothetical protein Golax_006344 [Gossypium laxum]|uniref:RNase H type-1 domain-containing protein n=1 Tax=Gossypium laxum TaxID=34288 RepID=A0A7J9A4Y8_9ROSI|nr:hypothetical protein [Gossypium laxum]
MLTNVECVRRGIGQNRTCSVCGKEPKDTIHVLRDCSAAKEIWKNIIPDNQLFRRYTLPSWELDFGVSRYLGRCSVFEVELWGILDRFLVLLNRGFRRVIVQFDNVEVVKVLQDEAIMDSRMTLLRRIQQIMRIGGQWRIRYIPRENNLVVDYLAKLSLTRSGLQIFDDVPNEVLKILQQDKASGVFSHFNMM